MTDDLKKLQEGMAETERILRWERQRRRFAETRLHQMTCEKCHPLKRFFCFINCPIGG